MEKLLHAVTAIAINAVLCGCQSQTRPGADVVVGLDDAVAVSALEHAESGIVEPQRACDFDSIRREIIARYDTDRDRELDAPEREALRRDFGGRAKHKKQQQLARLEHVKLLRWIYDANADRKVDAGEWQTLREDLDVRCQNSRLASSRDAAQRAAEHKRFDTNLDGRLDSREEAAAWDARRLGIAMHWRTLIDRFDTNGNGLLDKRERAALSEYERSAVRGERANGAAARVEPQPQHAPSDAGPDGAR